MPKQIYKIRDFSGGINNTRNTKDLSENESVQVQNFSVDIAGSMRSAGTFSAHTNHTASLKDIDSQNARLKWQNSSQGGGYHLYYFESDHDTTADDITPVAGKISFSVGISKTLGGFATTSEIDSATIEDDYPT